MIKSITWMSKLIFIFLYVKRAIAPQKSRNDSCYRVMRIVSQL